MIAVLVIHRQFWIFLGLHPVAQAHSQWFSRYLGVQS